MPQAAVKKDTSVVRDGLTTSVQVYSYVTDELQMSMVSTEVIRPGEKNKNAATEVTDGFRKGMQKRALSEGLSVTVRDTVLAGSKCSIGSIKGPQATLYAYAVLHGRFFYVFSHTIMLHTENSEADVKKFMSSIAFSKEEPAADANAMEDSAAYKFGQAIGYLLLPAIIITVIIFFVRRGNKSKTA